MKYKNKELFPFLWFSWMHVRTTNILSAEINIRSPLRLTTVHNFLSYDTKHTPPRINHQQQQYAALATATLNVSTEQYSG